MKTVFQVGDKHTDSYNARLGYPVEIVPLQSPYRRSGGETLDLLILADGKPLANQLVYAGHSHHGKVEASEHTHADKAAEAADHSHKLPSGLRSDADGIVRVNLTGPGHWYVRFIYMREVDAPDMNYISEWATITFEVR